MIKQKVMNIDALSLKTKSFQFPIIDARKLFDLTYLVDDVTKARKQGCLAEGNHLSIISSLKKRSEVIRIYTYPIRYTCIDKFGYSG